ncbi:hypothetical protein MOQ_001718 [Trypanosoma cruzi marinkellei]|uniref:Uncharacterized protein n=1 Tax=Trypanosoma cruzi marinkellei TaxID=85056 RepID=K2NSV9_TRYCR|nr:hypothetical protein MOQ_001718 [Trypanosoma cruzi marinkellei]
MALNSVELFPQETAVLGDELFTPAEGLCTILGPLEAGETYAREILQRQWFRGFSALKAKSDMEEAGMAMLRKHGLGAENPQADDGANEQKEEEEEEELQQRHQHVGMAAERVKQQRQRGELLYEERTERQEMEREEFEGISKLQLQMEENLSRLAQEEESMAMLQLIHDVMKPKFRQRYIFAWGIVTAVASPPTWSELDRIRCSQRHKPAYMRLPPLTCQIPIEPNPFWKSLESYTEPVGLIRM